MLKSPSIFVSILASRFE